MFNQLRILLAQIRTNYNAIEQDNEKLRKAYTQLSNDHQILQSKYDQMKNDYDECKRNLEKATQEVSDTQS